MNKKVLYALVIIALSVVVFVFNTDKMDVNILFTTICTLKAIVLLVFMGIGVLVGVLLK